MKNFIKTFIQDSRAAVTLLATITTSGILIFALIMHQIAGLRIFQAEVGEALSVQTGVTMAKFDRTLEERYGLWGIRAEAANTAIFDRITKDIARMPLLPPTKVTATTDCSDPLSAAEFAKPQIHAYMRLRAPVGLVKEIYERVQSAKHAITPNLKQGKSKLGVAKDAWQRHRKSILDFKDKAIPSKVRPFLEPVFKFLAMEENEAGGESWQKVLAQMSNVENALSINSIPVYDALLVNEYAIDSFSNAAGKFGESTTFGKTWGGFSKAALKTVTPYEVEYIITGIEDKEKAAKRVKLYLRLLRWVQHIIGIYSKPMKRAVYRTAAIATTALVFAFSGGTVYIPSAVFEAIFIAVRAFTKSGKDVKTLLAGKTVPLQPGYNEVIQVYYKDFLRLFLLPVSEDNKVKRAVELIEANLSGHFFTGVVVNADITCGRWQGGRVGRKENYELLRAKK